MDKLIAGRLYAFGCFNNQTFKVLATHKSEAWVYWLEDGKTQVVDIVRDDLAELVEE
mgnify:CR=1 FL=1